MNESKVKVYPQYVACIIASGMAFSGGIAYGWSSPVGDELLKGAFGFPISVYEYSWIAAAMPLGGLISCIPSGYLIDLVGRQFALLLIVIPQAFGWVLIRAAQNFWFLFFGRLITGIVAGVTTIAIPLYTGEIATKDNRGFLGMLFNLQSYGGVLFVYVVGAFLDPLSTTIVSLAVPLIISVFAMFIPESPVFLMQKGREDEAKKMLQMLRGTRYDMTEELASMKEDFKSWTEERKTFIASLKSRACIRALYISSGLLCFQQLCGLGPIMFYAFHIFTAAKIEMDAHHASITIGAVQFVSKLIATFFADRMGRRFWLLLSSGFTAFSHLSLALYFFFLSRDEKQMESLQWVPVASLCIFVGMFSFGFGSIPWIMIGELFPPDIKGVASSIPISIFWLFTFVMTKLYVNLHSSAGYDIVFFLFSVSTVLAFLFVLFFVPETRRKSLKDILSLLEGNRN